MPQLGELYTLIRGGIIPPHPLARDLIPRAPMLFYNINAPKVAGETVAFGAMLY